MPSTTEPKHQDIFWRLLILSALHFAAIAAMLLSARWIIALGGSKSILGWFSAGILPGLVLGAPLAGRLANRIAERHLILCGITLVASSLIALAHCADISAWLLLWRFVQGFGHGIVFACLFSLAAHSIPEGKKAQGIGYIALCIQIGNLGGVTLAEWLLLRSDFSCMYLGAATLSGLALFCALSLPAPTPRLTAATTEPQSPALRPTTRQLIITISFFFILGGSYGTVLQLIPLLVQNASRHSGETVLATPVLAALFLTVAACRLFLARLADGRHQRLVLVTFTLLMLLATLAWPLANSLSQLVLIAILFALGYGLLFPGLNGLVLARVAPEWRSRASGWVVTAFDGGFFGLLLLIGPLAEYGGYGIAFAVLATLQIGSGLIFLHMTQSIRD